VALVDGGMNWFFTVLLPIGISLLYYAFSNGYLGSAAHSTSERLFTAAELANYNGERSDVYLAILGEVYDVTSMARIYSVALNGSYSGFSAK
jgi:hypothetical protein